MSLKENFDKKKFIITSEIHLPFGKSPEDYLDEIYNLWGRVDGVRFEPFAGDAAISDSLALCRILKEKKFDPVFQVATRDQNRLEIQEAIINASSVGVENLLVFTEDYRITGDSLQEMMFFHVDMGKFFSVLDALKKGIDVGGKDVDVSSEFFVGSGVDASFGGNAPDMELREMEEMVKAGTKYFLTTPVFDVDEFARFVKRVETMGVPIIAELMMLHSGMQARMLKRVTGMKIPDRYVQRMEKAPVKFDESAKILLEMIKELKDLCSGVHVLTFGWESKIGRIIQDIRR